MQENKIQESKMQESKMQEREITGENLDIFKRELEKIVHINELILDTKSKMKPYQEHLKKLKIELKELEKNMCPIMEKNDLTQAKLPNGAGTIEYRTRQAMVPITQKSTKDKMIFFYKEGPGSHISFNSKTPIEKGTCLFDYIYDKKNRQFVKKEELKYKEDN